MTPHNIHMMPVLTYDGGVRYVGLGSTVGNSLLAAGATIPSPAQPIFVVGAVLNQLINGNKVSRDVFFQTRNQATEDLFKAGEQYYNLNFQSMRNYWYSYNTNNRQTPGPREKIYADDWIACLNHDHIGADSASASYLRPTQAIGVKDFTPHIKRLTDLSLPCFYSKYFPGQNAQPTNQQKALTPSVVQNTPDPPVKFASIPVIGPLITKYNSLDQEGRTIIAVTGALGGLVILTAIVQAIKEKRK